MKRGKSKFNFSNKVLLISIVIVLIVSAGVYALGSVPNPGHEILDLQTCDSDGQILEMSGGNWVCSSGGSDSWISSGLDIYYPGGGRVGIGTSSPASILSVGTAGVSGAAIYGEGTTYGVYGKGVATSGNNYGGYFTASGSSNDDYGVYGEGDRYGVYGKGIWAILGEGTTYGVRGSGAQGVIGDGKIGVSGRGTASSGNNYGGYFRALGSSGDDYGVYSQGSSYGVYGDGGRYGGYFTSSGISIGVYGEGKKYGLHGSGGAGAYGGNSGSGGIGVFGEGVAPSGKNYGGYFTASGSSDADYGVHAVGDTIGVHGSGNSYDFFAFGSGTNYGSSSSMRWKENITDISNALDKVLKLEGVYFDWNRENQTGHDMGFIAEQVVEIVPEVVSYDDETNESNWYVDENGEKKLYTTGVDYGALTPLLVEAIKELKEENNILRERVNVLEQEFMSIGA